jgi:predicted alpha/beta hydrolase family esterase
LIGPGNPAYGAGFSLHWPIQDFLYYRCSSTSRNQAFCPLSYATKWRVKTGANEMAAPKRGHFLIVEVVSSRG